MQSLTKTNVLFRFKKVWPQLFLNWVSCWKLTRKNVLCWGNCCQFGEQFLTDRIFWATFPKHSQNRCFIPSLHKITTVVWCYNSSILHEKPSISQTVLAQLIWKLVVSFLNEKWTRSKSQNVWLDLIFKHRYINSFNPYRIFLNP